MSKRKPNPRCCFTGDPISKRSKEHIYPDWLVKLTHGTREMRAFRIGDTKISGERDLKAVGPTNAVIPAEKKKNAEWGRDVEPRAKDIVTSACISQRFAAYDAYFLCQWIHAIGIKSAIHHGLTFKGGWPDRCPPVEEAINQPAYHLTCIASTTRQTLLSGYSALPQDPSAFSLYVNGVHFSVFVASWYADALRASPPSLQVAEGLWGELPTPLHAGALLGFNSSDYLVYRDGSILRLCSGPPGSSYMGHIERLSDELHIERSVAPGVDLATGVYRHVAACQAWRLRAMAKRLAQTGDEHGSRTHEGAAKRLLDDESKQDYSYYQRHLAWAAHGEHPDGSNVGTDRSSKYLPGTEPGALL